MNHSDSKRNRGISPYLLSAFLLFLIVPTASSGPVGALTTFTNGTVANADEVNQNFADLAVEINDNDTRITALEGAGQVISGRAINFVSQPDHFGVYVTGTDSVGTSILLLRSGTLSGFSCVAVVPPNPGDTVSVSVVVNGVAVGTPLQFTSADGTTMKSNAAVVNVNAGDLMTFKISSTAAVPGSFAPAIVYK